MDTWMEIGSQVYYIFEETVLWKNKVFACIQVYDKKYGNRSTEVWLKTLG